MKNKFIIILFIIILGLEGFICYKGKIVEQDNIKLTQENNELKEDNSQLEQNINSLIDSNNETSDQLKSTTNDILTYLEPLKESNKQEYLNSYKSIMEDSIDQPETIYEETTDDEFKLICQVVQAESGICDFNGKVNVATTIINRYYSEVFPNGWEELLTQGIQYTTVLNGSYLKQTEISQETIDAIEYAFLFGSDEVGDATYFHSGSSKWHKNNLELIYEDNYHKFYREEK